MIRFDFNAAEEIKYNLIISSGKVDDVYHRMKDLYWEMINDISFSATDIGTRCGDLMEATLTKLQLLNEDLQSLKSLYPKIIEEYRDADEAQKSNLYNSLDSFEKLGVETTDEAKTPDHYDTSNRSADNGGDQE